MDAPEPTTAELLARINALEAALTRPTRHRRRRPSRRTAVLGAVAAGLVVVAGTATAIATVPSSTTGAITGCVNKTTAAVRIIDAQAGKTCTTSETRVDWSKGYAYRGAYSATVDYNVLDVVTYGGSSYLAKANPVVGTAPSNTTSWGLLASKGATGATGPAGAPGPTGPQGTKGDTGATGPTGPTGTQGPKGDTGATGPQGVPGTNGTNGVSVTSTSFGVGGDSHCPNGGSRFVAVSGTTYACNGTNGTNAPTYTAGNGLALSGAAFGLKSCPDQTVLVADSTAPDRWTCDGSTTLRPVAVYDSSFDGCALGTSVAVFCSTNANFWWQNYGGSHAAGFARDPFGRVTLEGLVDSGSVSPSGDGTIFILPQGYRPAAQLVFPVMCANGSGYPIAGRVDVLTNGSVVSSAFSPCATTGWVSLSGISFLAGQ